jgi:hypothetical protein
VHGWYLIATAAALHWLRLFVCLSLRASPELCAAARQPCGALSHVAPPPVPFLSWQCALSFSAHCARLRTAGHSARRAALDAAVQHARPPDRTCPRRRVLPEYSRGTRGVLGYSRGTRGVLEGTHRLPDRTCPRRRVLPELEGGGRVPQLRQPGKHVPGIHAGSPHQRRDCARLCHICAGTRPPAATSAPGLRSSRPHQHRDCARLCHICAGTRPPAATSAPGLRSSRPHLRRDSPLQPPAATSRLTGTGLAPTTSAPGLTGPTPATSAPGPDAMDPCDVCRQEETFATRCHVCAMNTQRYLGLLDAANKSACQCKAGKLPPTTLHTYIHARTQHKQTRTHACTHACPLHA